MPIKLKSVLLMYTIVWQYTKRYLFVLKTFKSTPTILYVALCISNNNNNYNNIWPAFYNILLILFMNSRFNLSISGLCKLISIVCIGLIADVLVCTDKRHIKGRSWEYSYTVFIDMWVDVIYNIYFTNE